MTITDFNKTIEVLNLKENYKNEDEINWFGFELSQPKNYTIVNGKIPLEVADAIYKKYPDNKYGIRVGGGREDAVPYDYATSDEIKKLKEEVSPLLKNIGSFNKVMDILTDCKNNTNHVDLYIETYHVDTKEGLVILITELRNYYSKQLFGKSNMLDLELEQKRYIKEINKKLITEINLENIINSFTKDIDEKPVKTLFMNERIKKEAEKFDNLIKSFEKNFDILLENNENFSVSAYSNYENKADLTIKLDDESVIRISVNSEELYFNFKSQDSKSNEFSVSHYIQNGKSDRILIKIIEDETEYDLDTGDISWIKNMLKSEEMGITISFIQMLESINAVLNDTISNVNTKEKQKVK